MRTSRPSRARCCCARRPARCDTVAKCASDDNAGAISRQLQTTRIAERPGDRAIRVDDYPLLPVRRRFWEAAFPRARSAGHSGAAALPAPDPARRAERGGGPAARRRRARRRALSPTQASPRPVRRPASGRARPHRDLPEGLPRIRRPDAADRGARLPDLPPTARGRLGHRRAVDARAHRRSPGRRSRRGPDGLPCPRARGLRQARQGRRPSSRSARRSASRPPRGGPWEQDFRKFKGQYTNDFSAVADKREALLAEARDAVVGTVFAPPRRGEGAAPPGAAPRRQRRPRATIATCRSGCAPAGRSEKVGASMARDARACEWASDMSCVRSTSYGPKARRPMILRDDHRRHARGPACHSPTARRVGHGPSGEEARRGIETRQEQGRW